MRFQGPAPGSLPSPAGSAPGIREGRPSSGKEPQSLSCLQCISLSSEAPSCRPGHSGLSRGSGSWAGGWVGGGLPSRALPGKAGTLGRGAQRASCCKDALPLTCRPVLDRLQHRIPRARPHRLWSPIHAPRVTVPSWGSEVPGPGSVQSTNPALMSPCCPPGPLHAGRMPGSARGGPFL